MSSTMNVRSVSRRLKIVVVISIAGLGVLLGAGGYSGYRYWVSRQTSPPASPPAENLPPPTYTIDGHYPFDTTELSQGVPIGQITVTLDDLVATYKGLPESTLASATTSLGRWQIAADSLSRSAILLDEAVKAGFVVDGAPPHTYRSDLLPAAVGVLNTALYYQGGSGTASVGDLVTARQGEGLRLKAPSS